MDQTSLFVEAHDIVDGIISADFNSDQNGDWVNVAHAESCVIIVATPAGTAGDDLAFKLQQASDNAGTGAKALNFTRLDHKVGTAGVWTKATFTATDDLDLGEATEGAGDIGADDTKAIIVVEVRANSMDFDNGFTYLRYQNEGDDVANALTVTVLYILKNLHYKRDVPVINNLS